MQSQFCHNCGKKMAQFGLKFCPHCGTNLSSLNASPPPEEEPQSTFRPRPARPSRPQQTFVPFAGRPASVDIDDDDYDPYENAGGIEININSLDVEIGPPNRGKDTIGGLMATGPTGGDDKRPIPQVGAKELIDSIQKEGAALRPKTSERQHTKAD
jgi:hypothetical protein